MGMVVTGVNKSFLLRILLLNIYRDKTQSNSPLSQGKAEGSISYTRGWHLII
jgi:hypothetical protein